MLSVEENQEICILTIDAPRFDSAVGTLIRNAVMSRLDTMTRFVVDMSKVKLVDSGGLGSLVVILKNATSNKAELYLAGMQKPVRLMFELSRMDRQFNLFDDVKSACESLQKKA